MSHRVHLHLHLALSTGLPTLLAALVVLVPLAIGRVLPWAALPAVAVALTVQTLVTFVRLEHTTAEAALKPEDDAGREGGPADR
ncbi:hypothetical protein [Saccharothrix sp. ST-888]|uniref:hypothetical protein n=1 Tax=Saccharothrix sp. ST-888 TaxID=1427391 RepID=UPI0005ED1202|nr:hypothetical protein [Saccharothrix sp. ST-888]KJK56640.1 hypothetical protein UK12_21340 [Saccharothrix sp. ST-888]